MSGISIHYALDMIEDQLGIYRTKKTNATTRVNGVLGGIKALQAALDARLADIDRLQDKYAADEHLIETLKVECGSNLADKQHLAAENNLLRDVLRTIAAAANEPLVDIAEGPYADGVKVMDGFYRSVISGQLKRVQVQ